MAVVDELGDEVVDPRLRVWERRATPFVVAAAIIPLAGMFTRDPEDGIAPLVEVVCWLVFLADLVVHVRFRRRYLTTPMGIFDLSIVLITFPWYLVVPGGETSDFLVAARLARVARVGFVAYKSAGGLRVLAARLGTAAIYAASVVMVCALIVKRVEPPSSGFATLWDAVWWAIVTITTVGYGDYVPVTVAGRVAGIVLMVAGIALLGTLAGSLASFFTDEEAAEHAQEALSGSGSDVADELRALRAEVAALRQEIVDRS